MPPTDEKGTKLAPIASELSLFDAAESRQFFMIREFLQARMLELGAVTGDQVPLVSKITLQRMAENEVSEDVITFEFCFGGWLGERFVAAWESDGQRAALYIGHDGISEQPTPVGKPVEDKLEKFMPENLSTFTHIEVTTAVSAEA